jgi:hypothetical protein
MVVTSAPWSDEIGIWQERIARPLTCTVHAPHSAMPHPYLVPFKSSVSRSTHNSGVSGATSTVLDCPLTLNVTGMADRLREV